MPGGHDTPDPRRDRVGSGQATKASGSYSGAGGRAGSASSSSASCHKVGAQVAAEHVAQQCPQVLGQLVDERVGVRSGPGAQAGDHRTLERDRVGRPLRECAALVRWRADRRQPRRRAGRSPALRARAAPAAPAGSRSAPRTASSRSHPISNRASAQASSPLGGRPPRDQVAERRAARPPGRRGSPSASRGASARRRAATGRHGPLSVARPGQRAERVAAALEQPQRGQQTAEARPRQRHRRLPRRAPGVIASIASTCGLVRCRPRRPPPGRCRAYRRGSSESPSPSASSRSRDRARPRAAARSRSSALCPSYSARSSSPYASSNRIGSNPNWLRSANTARRNDRSAASARSRGSPGIRGSPR